MSAITPAKATAESGRLRRPGRSGGTGIRGRENYYGWLFIAPVVVILGLFLLLPIFMALWVSLLEWNGQSSPFAGGIPFRGLDKYKELIFEPGLTRRDFMTSLRNNFYYVLIVVPVQTVLALLLAVIVNQKFLKGKGFFRTAFYFPSVTSSVAISIVFLFLFQNTGAVNAVLGWVGIQGPQWYSDARGLIHLVLDKVGLVDLSAPPAALVDTEVLGLPLWEWFAGPSVAMMTIISLVTWTTAGTFMLMFLAALQDIPVEIDEAALIDGTTKWQRFRYVTLPQLKPALFLVLTLGLIGTWQVFDQVYVMSQGAPAKTTLTPAYLSYRQSFREFDYSSGAAMAFILFGIIIALTLFQRYVLRDKDVAQERKDIKAARRRAGKASV